MLASANLPQGRQHSAFTVSANHLARVGSLYAARNSHILILSISGSGRIANPPLLCSHIY